MNSLVRKVLIDKFGSNIPVDLTDKQIAQVIHALIVHEKRATSFDEWISSHTYYRALLCRELRKERERKGLRPQANPFLPRVLCTDDPNMDHIRHIWKNLPKGPEQLRAEAIIDMYLAEAHHRYV